MKRPNPWREELERDLPPRDQRLDRNRAITARYARWYLEHPSFFKWAGMAVSGSYIAGQYLRVMAGPRDQGAARFIPESVRRKQAQILASTNNDVFDDIAWTHLAYAAADGGFPAVEAGLSELPTHALLLQGFRLIDSGRRLVASEPERGHRLIREGNLMLLKHEQLHTVQPYFARFDRSFGRFLSAAATADYRLGSARVQQTRWPRFTPFMIRHARPLMRRTGTMLPDIQRFDQRWHWIEADAFPCYVEMESARQSAMLTRFEELARGSAQ